MQRARFKSAIPFFQLPKAVRALDRSANGADEYVYEMHIFNFLEYIQLSSIANGVTEVQITRTESVHFVNVLHISPAYTQFPLELASNCHNFIFYTPVPNWKIRG
jgi:hypothetical protein